MPDLPLTIRELQGRVQSVPGLDGQITTVKQRFTPQEIVDYLKSALSSPYNGKDPKKLGMSKGEAAFLSLAEFAQEGDVTALETLLNRLLGKPIQQINSLNVSASLSEFLGSLAAEMEKVEPFADEVDPLGD